jgi:hypothetical protein
MARRERLQAVWIALACAVVLLILFGLILAFLAARPVGRISASAIFVTASAVVLLLLAAAFHRARPRAGSAAALAGLAWALPIAVGDAHALERTMVYGERSVRYDGGSSDLDVVLTVVGCLVIFAVVGLSIVGADRRRDRAVYRIGWCAVVLGAIAVALPLVKWGRPDPDGYVESLEVRATLQEGESLRLGGNDFRYGRAAREDVYDDCALLGVSQAPRVARLLDRDEPCPPIRVLLDPRGDLAVVARGDQAEVAFRVADARAVSVSVRTLASRVAAPIAWRIAGAGSLVLGVLLLGVAARLRRRAASFSGRDAHHDGGGFVVFPDGVRLLLPVSAALPVGAITLYGEMERAASYRDLPGPTFRAARAGSLGARRASDRDLAAALAAIALTVVVIGTTPLVVAGIYGF